MTNSNQYKDMPEPTSESGEWIHEEEIKPIKKERTSHLIEKQIKKIIFKKNLPVGTKLPPERELAAIFDVSRTSVKDAMRSLERCGLIYIKKGTTGGAFILKSVSPHVVELMVDMFESGEVSLEEVLDVRLIIEPHVAAEAAKKATPEDIDRLNKTVDMLLEEYKSPEDVVQNNPRFHSVLGEISENRVCSLIMRVLVQVHAERIRSINLPKDSRGEIIEQHKQIISAIAKHDPEMARALMREHIMRVHEIHKGIEEKS